METQIKRKDIPPQRREQILRAATELFSQGGYHGVTVDAIAQKAGISKGNLYWYFKSKQEIFQLLFEDIGARLFTPFLEVMLSDAPARDKLKAFAAATMDGAESDPEALALILQILAQPELRELLTSEWSMLMIPFIDFMKPLFTEIGDKNPEGSAMLYAMILDYIMLLPVLGPEAYDRQKLMAALEDKFFSQGGGE